MARTLINPDNIPQELKDINHWVLWKYEDAGGKKPTKIPYNPVTRAKASTTAPTTWTAFETATLMYQHYKEYNGIGFVLDGSEGIIGIDIDGEINLELIDRFDSYSELTPSKNGCRIYIKADCQLAKKKIKNLEFYREKRFFTVTGDKLNEATSIFDKSIEFESFYQELVESLKNTAVAAPTVGQIFKSKKVWYSGLNFDEILTTIWDYEKCKDNKNRFDGFYPDGDNNDMSLTEWNLARCFAYHTRDYELTLALMYKSTLDKSKWSKQSGAGNTRVEVTVFNALKKVVEKYGDNAPNYRQKKFVSNMNLDNIELFPI